MWAALPRSSSGGMWWLDARTTRSSKGEFGKAAVELSWCADLAQKLHKHKAASREQYMHLTCVHVYMGKDMSDYILVMCL